MPARNVWWTRREVSPLELFFDLVFVLAVGQLAHHLLGHLSWTGVAETLIALVAVCGVWAFTSFEATMLDVERGSTRATIIAVMALGLFMNAGVSGAFEEQPWLFVVPMMLALAGPGAYAAATAPTPELRGHFRRVLGWLAVSVPFWIVGAALSPEARIWLWAVAALVDLTGTWTAHPAPGRALQSARLPFDAEHMIERMRLFLIILLGETVLALGRVLTEHAPDAPSLLMVLGGFAALVCLWAIYFGRTEQQVVSHASATEDPIRSVHAGLNAIYGVVAGLVAFAAGIELALAHGPGHPAGTGGVLLLGGPMVYLLAQAWYFRVETGTGWLPRAGGGFVLGAGAVAAYWLPAWAAVAVLVVILLGLTAYLAHGWTGPRPGTEPAASS
ncbi:low temperature requirement protein A [Amycolatopsis sp. NPDC004079]|uniref:low temperature requirement protein A n=1 Tax=Amycolatopsis sp. NPDC004079 TaxID=3154549 RepID=UPI0033A4E20E